MGVKRIKTMNNDEKESTIAKVEGALVNDLVVAGDWIAAIVGKCELSSRNRSWLKRGFGPRLTSIRACVER